MKSGLVSITFRKLSVVEIIELVSRAGLDGVEWGGDVHVPHGEEAVATETAARTMDAGLQVAAYGSYYRAGMSGKEGLDFSRVLASAVALRAPTIRVWAGKNGSAEVTSAERADVIGDLVDIAEQAAGANISISLEYHGGTLTDTNESAAQVLREAGHPNLFTYWQPHNGVDTETCLAGLRMIRDRLSHLHVFHWWPSAKDRHPLAAGAERWGRFLAEIPDAPDRFAMLEFVRGDEPSMFLKDAAVLKEWLGA